jgi:UDP-N-acetylmuramyl pentapeptide phosphotransferase/UDP-N-acetylglucosamine-1-phosphate transferase
MTEAQVVVLIVAAVAAAAVSAALTHLLARGRFAALDALDHPNERSLHRAPVPRTGGLALLAGVVGVGGPLLGAASLLDLVDKGALTLLLSLVAALVLVAGISFLDDRRDVPRRLRFGVHLLAAGLLWMGGLRWETLGLPGLDAALPAVLVLPLSLLYCVWMINLYNFMDGMDGLAGSMAVFGFGALAALGLSGGEPLFGGLCALVAAAAAGFLTANFPPARIFLGDVGSSSLGLLAAALTLWGAELSLYPLWAGWLAFSPFIVDATWTLVRRGLKREALWRAHRSHHYQRLVLAGWGHRRTLLRGMLLMAGVAATAVAAPGLPVPEQWLLIAGWVGIYVLVHLRVTLAERAASGTQT